MLGGGGNRIRVPVAFRNKCERITGPQPERVRSIFAGVNATRTSGTGPERDRNGNGTGTGPERDRNGTGTGPERERDRNGNGTGTGPERDRNGNGTGTRTGTRTGTGVNTALVAK